MGFIYESAKFTNIDQEVYKSINFIFHQAYENKFGLQNKLIQVCLVVY